MKKVATIILVCVLTCSFFVGAFVTDAQARKANSPNDRVTPVCVKPFKVPVCNMEDCRMYEVYYCPYGVIMEWTGEYCPTNSGCWDPIG